MAWARVRGTSAVSGANPTSLGITHPAADVVNNRLLVGVSYNGNNAALPTTSTVNDTTNTYVSDRSRLDATQALRVRGELWSANVVSSTTPTVTVTLSAALTGGDGIALTIEEYSGLSTASNAVDVATDASGLGTNTSGNTAATTAANELVIGLYTDDGASATPTAVAMTARDNIASGIADIMHADKDSTALNIAQSVTFTPGEGGGMNVILCVVYKLFVAGGAATPSRPTGILTVQQAMNRLANFFRRLRFA